LLELRQDTLTLLEAHSS